MEAGVSAAAEHAIVPPDGSVTTAKGCRPAGAGHGTLHWFLLRGVVDGAEVCAYWHEGVLACDEALRQRAVGGEGNGEAVRIMLGLVRACDGVSAIDVGMDP